MQGLEKFVMIFKEKAYDIGKVLLWALAFPILISFRCGRAYERMEVLNSGKWVRVRAS